MKNQNIFKSIQRNRLKNYSALLVGVFVLTSIFTSCESFLSQTSTNDVADDDMFTDAASLESARIGLYNTLQNQYYYGGFYPLMADAYSDNGATGGYDNLDLDELGYKVATPNNIYIENCWIAMYNTIYTANQIITNAPLIDDPTLSEELRNDIIAEALTIRALAHFDLLRLFGEHWDNASTYGIPVVTSILSPEDAVGRSTVAATYEAIINDLVTAESMLSNDDLRFDPPTFKGPQFITKTANQALQARVYQYQSDYANALIYADKVLNDGFASIVLAANIGSIYNTKFSSEAIFELAFNGQDKSQFNALTFARPDALRSEVSFLAAADLKAFYESRPGDVRASLVDFVNNDLSIEPDGRTQKYRGEVFQDNSAFVIRYSEMLLIKSEAGGLAAGLEQLNYLRSLRGMPIATPLTGEEFLDALVAERRSELNFEGHRYFDLAHFGMVSTVLGESVLPCFPIPNREINASGGLIVQYPGY
jgi:starch-binding outer membrane protein, SusD/RagB family